MTNDDLRADGFDDGFDARIRQAHAEAVSHLSARTRLQLQLRRGAATATRGKPAATRSFAWPLAAACAVGALAIGLQLRQPEAPGTTPAPDPARALASATPDASVADAWTALDESPDLYLWLESDDAAMLAME
jgi:hypothetical protein